MLALSTIWKSLEGDGKNPDLLTQKLSLLGLVLTSANPEIVFLRLEFAAFYPRGSREKQPDEKELRPHRSQEQTSTHELTLSHVRSHKQAEKRHHLRRGKGRLFSLLVSWFFFFYF